MSATEAAGQPRAVGAGRTRIARRGLLAGATAAAATGVLGRTALAAPGNAKLPAGSIWITTADMTTIRTESVDEGDVVQAEKLTSTGLIKLAADTGGVAIAFRLGGLPTWLWIWHASSPTVDDNAQKDLTIFQVSQDGEQTRRFVLTDAIVRELAVRSVDGDAGPMLVSDAKLVGSDLKGPLGDGGKPGSSQGTSVQGPTGKSYVETPVGP